MKYTYRYMKVNNKGITLLELIIVVAIMGALIGVILPQYLKYVDKSKKALDLKNAETIAKAFELVLLNNPEFYEMYDKAKGTGADYGIKVNNLPEQVAGEGKTSIIAFITSEDFGFFSGTGSIASVKNGEGKTIYEALNDELGIKYVDMKTAQKWQKNKSLGEHQNDIMVPKYKIKRQGAHPGGGGRQFSNVDRWRICKNAKTGQLEIWAADGSQWGGYPCFRVWPVPNDAYTNK